MSESTTLDALLASGAAFTDPPTAAVILDADERTIRAAIKAGDIPATRVGQRWKIPVAWLRRAAAA